MSLLQLNPPLELETPKGKGYAWFLIDYGAESDLYWVTAINETHEVWTFANHEVRAAKNITLGRDKVSRRTNECSKCKGVGLRNETSWACRSCGGTGKYLGML